MMAMLAAERAGSLQPMSFRTTADLRARIEESASREGRSLTQELEHRLERSFVRDEIKQYIDGLLSDSLVKGGDLEKAEARIRELEEALQRSLSEDAIERAVSHALERALERLFARQAAGMKGAPNGATVADVVVEGPEPVQPEPRRLRSKQKQPA